MKFNSLLWVIKVYMTQNVKIKTRPKCLNFICFGSKIPAFFFKKCHRDWDLINHKMTSRYLILKNENLRSFVYRSEPLSYLQRLYISCGRSDYASSFVRTLKIEKSISFSS